MHNKIKKYNKQFSDDHLKSELYGKSILNTKNPVVDGTINNPRWYLQ